MEVEILFTRVKDFFPCFPPPIPINIKWFIPYIISKVSCCCNPLPLEVKQIFISLWLQLYQGRKELKHDDTEQMKFNFHFNVSIHVYFFTTITHSSSIEGLLREGLLLCYHGYQVEYSEQLNWSSCFVSNSQGTCRVKCHIHN